jgi:hypothetical protein
MYTIFTFFLMGSVALGCWLLYRLRMQQKNTSAHYKRLLDGILTPMYIYDD